MRILLFILLFIPASLFAQKPLKNAKVINLTVEEGKSKDQLITDLSNYLINNGYEISRTDKDLGTIQTGTKSISFWGARLTVTVNDSNVKFRGKVIMDNPIGGNEINRDIENKGSLGSAYVKTWQEMNTIATAFPHTSIEYQK